MKLLVQNVFGEDVPPPMNWTPKDGGLGSEEKKYYFELGLAF